VSNKQTAVVICPGRGTYNASELGYLKQISTGNKVLEKFVCRLDAARQKQGQISLSDLDGAERFSARTHGSGENASALIYACALADFKSIDLNKYEIVAVTGNSMGWYLALACSGVLAGDAGFNVVNTMGTLMQSHGVGGQVIYPLVDEQWQADFDLIQRVETVVKEVNARKDCQVYPSIRLGGMQILAGNDAAVAALLKALPTEQGRYPFQLNQHAAFHSALLGHIPEMARQALPASLFGNTNLPLIDGRGKIWQPGVYDPDALYRYTLDHQIRETYDFSAAIEVALKEFAPDKLIILGPGTTLGPPVAQTLIQHGWMDLHNKAEFISLQKTEPFVLSMGIESQRAHVVQT